MKTKLIVSDVDGTLYQSDHTISGATNTAIKGAIEAGHHFAVATGRMHGAGKLITRELPYDGFLISCNGAVVKHVVTGDVIHAVALEKEDLIKAVEICKDADVYFHMYDSESIYVFKLEHLAKRYSDLMPSLPEDLRFDIKVIQDLSEIEDKDIYKVGLFSEDPVKFEKVVSGLKAMDAFEMCFSMKTSFDINAKGVTKASGIEALRKYYDIEREDIIAFGDNDNDRDMISYAGLGVAMGNAVEPLKLIADRVTKTNDEDGIALVLNEVLK